MGTGERQCGQCRAARPTHRLGPVVREADQRHLLQQRSRGAGQGSQRRHLLQLRAARRLRRLQRRRLDVRHHGGVLRWRARRCRRLLRELASSLMTSARPRRGAAAPLACADAHGRSRRGRTYSLDCARLALPAAPARVARRVSPQRPRAPAASTAAAGCTVGCTLRLLLQSGSTESALGLCLRFRFGCGFSGSG